MGGGIIRRKLMLMFGYFDKLWFGWHLTMIETDPQSPFLLNQPELCLTEQATTWAHRLNLVFTVWGLSPSHFPNKQTHNFIFIVSYTYTYSKRVSKANMNRNSINKLPGPNRVWWGLPRGELGVSESEAVDEHGVRVDLELETVSL